ncbi:hypothetical protein MVEG_00958 [Podila verticillata NRRL 6337]|nr:hypothetical protein MVEG_00958 [Podila verticillata NRRL 6337]
MAVAMMSRKKAKGRSRQRSPSSRAFEEEDEDMVIVSRLENEPWQPDLLLERQSGPETNSSKSASGALVSSTGSHAKDNLSDGSTKPVGFQGVIPVIIKSPSSVITTADSDCVESVFEDPTVKRPGIQEYLQQTHQEQQLHQRQLQYQMPAHLQKQRQQYRNSFHGHSTSPFFHLGEDTTIPMFQSRPTSAYDDEGRNSMDDIHESKDLTDSEEVVESLQSLKNLAMLALDGLLQQVVSNVTASDPVFNPDETTLQARALIRRRSGGNLLDIAEAGDLQSTTAEKKATSFSHGVSTVTTTEDVPSYPRQSHGIVSGMAASSFERLDELARKVDQLAVVVTDEGMSHVQEQVVPSQATSTPQQRTTTARVVDSAQIFESQEYQMACALAAMLACVYRILNRMQESRVPLRTESADSGLDQASRLWKRLSSNSFARRPLSQKSVGSWPLSPEKKVISAVERTSMSSSTHGTGGFIQSINRQVRTLRSRRTQSTSHIEVPSMDGKRSKKLLSGLGFGSSQRNLLQPEDAAQTKKSKEQEQEQDWTELDKLMDEMSDLLRVVESLEDNNPQVEETQKRAQGKEGLTASRIVVATEEQLSNPFHDRYQLSSNIDTSIQETHDKISFDQQTLDMAVSDDLPQYDDHFREAPQYREKAGSLEPPGANITRRTSRRSMAVSGGLEDEKTRYDLNNVMSAIERLSKVAPRMDDQRVQLSASQERTMDGANVAHKIERLSRGRWEDQRASSPSTSSVKRSNPRNAEGSSNAASVERTRDLNNLVSQIVESAKASYTNQKAEFSPRQQWKLEGSKIGDRIERGEKMRMSDQDWQAPEKVLLKDMTRLTNALYQQSATSQAFATQRFTLTEDKARTMALQGIISKIERLSDRRMDNQDALPPSATTKSRASLERGSPAVRTSELQDMIDHLVESGGGPTRRSAMTSQRAEFNHTKSKSE